MVLQPFLRMLVRSTASDLVRGVMNRPGMPVLLFVVVAAPLFTDFVGRFESSCHARHPLKAVGGACRGVCVWLATTLE